MGLKLVVVTVCLVLVAAACSGESHVEALAGPAAAQLASSDTPVALDESRRVYFEYPIDANGELSPGRFGAESEPPVAGDDPATSLSLSIDGNVVFTDSGRLVSRSDGNFLRFEAPLPLTDYDLRLTRDSVLLVEQSNIALVPPGDTRVHVELEVDPDNPTRSRGLTSTPRLQAGQSVGAQLSLINPAGEGPTVDEMGGEVRELRDDVASSGTEVTFAVLDADGAVLVAGASVIRCDMLNGDVVVQGCIAGRSFAVQPGAASVVAVIGDDIVDRFDAGAEAPQVLSASPNADSVLEANESPVFEVDATNDGDTALQYQGQALQSNGSFLGLGRWDNEPSYEPRSGSLGNIVSGEFRMLVTDGLHITAAPLEKPRWKPTVWILKNQDLSPRFEAGAFATSFPADAQSVMWSTGDGFVWTEPELFTTDLPVGTHELTFEVTAANGLMGSDSIEVQICADAEGFHWLC